MNKYIVYGLIGAFVLGFAGGEYFSSPKTTTLEKTTQTDTQTKQNEVTHKKTTTVQEGNKTTTTTIEDTQINTKSATDTDTKVYKTVILVKKTVNVSALVGYSLSTFPVPIYGISVSKELLGPVTVGVFGLTNGIVGISLGINF